MDVFKAERDGLARGIQVQACILKSKVGSIDQKVSEYPDRALINARERVLFGFIGPVGDCDRMGADSFARPCRAFAHRASHRT